MPRRSLTQRRIRFAALAIPGGALVGVVFSLQVAVISAIEILFLNDLAVMGIDGWLNMLALALMVGSLIGLCAGVVVGAVTGVAIGISWALGGSDATTAISGIVLASLSTISFVSILVSGNREWLLFSGLAATQGAAGVIGLVWAAGLPHAVDGRCES